MPKHAAAVLICVHRRDLRPWKGPAARPTLELVRTPTPAQPEPLPAPPPSPPPESPPSPKPKARGMLPIARPKVRGDCLPGGHNEARPCPFAACRYHLAVHADGPDLIVVREDVSELPHTCALDIADVTDDTGRAVLLRSLEPYFGVTRENVRRLQNHAIREFAEGLRDGGVSEAELERIVAGAIKGATG